MSKKEFDNSKPLIINMFAGPGAGKSTSSAGLFYKMKLLGYNVELINEYAKRKTFEKNHISLSKQYYISAKQIYYQELAERDYDFIITDSPILLGSVYSNLNIIESNIINSETINIERINNHFISEVFRSKNNLNIFIERNEETYSYIGRNQTLEESKLIDDRIINTLDELGYDFLTVKKDYKKQEKFFDKIIKEFINPFNENRKEFHKSKNAKD